MTDLIKCACGCEGLRTQRDRKGRLRKFIYGHYWLGKKFSEKHKKNNGLAQPTKIRFTLEMDKCLIESYVNQQNSTRTTGKVLGLGDRVVRGRLKELGIRIRGTGEINCGKKAAEAHKKKISVALAKRIAGGRIPWTMTKPHKLFIQLFEDNFCIKLETEHQLVTDDGSPRFYDCKMPNTNILFEIDGNFWHSRPKQKIRDAEKDALAKKLGYRLYRVPEDKIIEFIQSFVMAFTLIKEEDA